MLLFYQDIYFHTSVPENSQDFKIANTDDDNDNYTCLVYIHNVSKESQPLMEHYKLD